jgi:hypothetical protein
MNDFGTRQKNQTAETTMRGNQTLHMDKKRDRLRQGGDLQFRVVKEVIGLTNPDTFNSEDGDRLS